jgi:hypothetical protein
MVQVVTNENMLDLIQNRSVPEFKAPEAPKTDAQPEQKVEKPAETPRGEDGKFVAKVEGEKPEDKPAQKVAEATDDDDLSQASEAIRKKIDKLVAKKHRAMKEAEEFGRDEARRALAAEARADALQREIEALKGTKSAGPTPSGDEPKMEDFKTVGEYANAVVEWKLNQKLAERDAKSEKQTQKQQQESAREAFGRRVAEYAKGVEDYYEVVQAADIEVPAHIAQHMVESDFGPAMGYFFAKDPQELDRIKALSPIRAIAELGKLEIKLAPAQKAEKPAAEVKEISKAPPPIQPLEGKTTPVETDPAKMDFKQLRAFREQQKQAGKWRV